jgi:hypothetical protein
MDVTEVLQLAIAEKRCVLLTVSGAERSVCPHALGLKHGRPRLLAFQYAGTSSSGLAPGGQWRSFFVSEIEAARFIAGDWRSGGSFIAKAEATLDEIEYRAR